MLDTSKPWWEVASVVASAAAAIVVAIFAAVQLWREHKREKEHRAAADARISALAFVLHAQVGRWLGEEPSKEDDFEQWIQDSQANGKLRKELSLAERRCMRLVEVAVDASPRVARHTREAFVTLVDATRRIRKYSEMSAPVGVAFLDWLQLRNDAATDLREFLRHLEAAPIQAELSSAERALVGRRHRENPWE